MKRPASKIVIAALVAGAFMIVWSALQFAKRSWDQDGGTSDEALPCGEGFVRQGTRCCPSSSIANAAGLCVSSASTCPSPLVWTESGCDAPFPSVVFVPATSVIIGPSDWEAEGRVQPRTVKTSAFAIDRFEVSVGQIRCDRCPSAIRSRFDGQDVGRAASNVSLEEARAVCAVRGGRLPTEDEWIVAAAGDKPRRYPWGDTGAVCRRAAWGLAKGPCSAGATGPDTVGAHQDGATPLGIHDLAGNVAEWVEPDACKAADAGDCTAIVRGGSFETDLATDLRMWVRREVSAKARSASIGFRCAYEPVGFGDL